MSFNIDNAISQMVGAMKSSLGADVKDISSYATQVFENQKESLAELSQALLDGDLDQQEFEQELQREKLVSETELLALQVMGKAAIQQALTAAFNVLIKLVKPI